MTDQHKRRVRQIVDSIFPLEARERFFWLVMGWLVGLTAGYTAWGL